MQRRKDSKRPRISVSLDPEDYDWIDALGSPSNSLSFKVSRLVKAARVAGLTIEDATGEGPLAEFRDWLAQTKRKSKLAQELQELLAEFLKQ